MPVTNTNTLCAAGRCSSVAASDELPFGSVTPRCPLSLLGSGAGQPKFGSRSMVCSVNAHKCALPSGIYIVFSYSWLMQGNIYVGDEARIPPDASR
jgi:hypothetical protein